MSRKWVSVAALLGMVCAVVLVAGVAGAQDDKKPHTIKEIMGKVNNKKAVAKGGGLLHVIKKDLTETTPDWAGVKEKTKVIAEYAGDLGKNDPPKGEKEAWQKTTKEYADWAVALDKAASDKDLSAANKNSGAMLKACASCHGFYRP